MDSLGISTVLEGCRQLTKVAFNQINIAQTVYEHMAQKSTELQVSPASHRKLLGVAATYSDSQFVSSLISEVTHTYQYGAIADGTWCPRPLLMNASNRYLMANSCEYPYCTEQGR